MTHRSDAKARLGNPPGRGVLDSTVVAARAQRAGSRIHPSQVFAKVFLVLCPLMAMRHYCRSCGANKADEENIMETTCFSTLFTRQAQLYAEPVMERKLMRSHNYRRLTMRGRPRMASREILSFTREWSATTIHTFGIESLSSEEYRWVSDFVVITRCEVN